MSSTGPPDPSTHKRPKWTIDESSKFSWDLEIKDPQGDAFFETPRPCVVLNEDLCLGLIHGLAESLGIEQISWSVNDAYFPADGPAEKVTCKGRALVTHADGPLNFGFDAQDHKAKSVIFDLSSTGPIADALVKAGGDSCQGLDNVSNWVPGHWQAGPASGLVPTGRSSPFNDQPNFWDAGKFQLPLRIAWIAREVNFARTSIKGPPANCGLKAAPTFAAKCSLTGKWTGQFDLHRYKNLP